MEIYYVVFLVIGRCEFKSVNKFSKPLLNTAPIDESDDIHVFGNRPKYNFVIGNDYDRIIE